MTELKVATWNVEERGVPPFVQKMIDKAKATKPIEYPIMIWDSFKNLDPHYSSDGQFTGGLETVRWVRNGLIYEFVIFEGDLLAEHCITYPIEFEGV